MGKHSKYAKKQTIELSLELAQRVTAMLSERRHVRELERARYQRNLETDPDRMCEGRLRVIAQWRGRREKETPEERQARMHHARQSAREQYQRNHEEITYERRHTRLGTGGKIHKVRKRPYPDPPTCELCDETLEKPALSKLAYHHWNDKNLESGIWVCHRCHTACEFVDCKTEPKALIDKYLVLKGTIDESRNPGSPGNL